MLQAALIGTNIYPVRQSVEAFAGRARQAFSAMEVPGTGPAGGQGADSEGTVADDDLITT